MHSILGAWAFCIFAWLSTSACAIEADANPIGQVVQLLGVLSKQIEQEGKADASVYRDYSKSYQEEAQQAEVIIKESADKIALLQTDLQEAEAFRDGKQRDLVDLANQLAKSDAELTAGSDARKKERVTFEKNEATYTESLDQLERSVGTMRKKASSTESASASLLSVATRLKRALMQSSDLSISAAQKETLDGFVRSARASTPEAPSFLQYNARSGDLISTLQQLQVKVKRERQAALEAEQKQKTDFKVWRNGMQAQVENGKRSLTDIKSSIAQSQEQSSQKQAALMESQKMYKAEVQHMEQIEAEFRAKTQEYKVRLGRRSDEAVAVHEAQRILSSETAKPYVSQQSIGTTGEAAASFLQLAREMAPARRKALRILQSAKTPGVALLALKSTLSFKRGTDPFSKVKSMLKDMLQKLNDKQAQESKHSAWCDNEMGKTGKSMTRKGEDVQKMTDRLGAISAELSQIKSDIAASTADLKEINEAAATAVKIRQEEHKQAIKSTKQYTDASALLLKACNVLKGYYKKKSDTGAEKQHGSKQRQGMGTGIIGILELAIDDFKQLSAGMKESENAAAKDFKEMQEESVVRKAVFQKDLDWKSRTKVKLEFEESTMTNDLKSYQAELLAIDTYSDKLKGSCIVKGPSYEERKAKRAAEIQSLREALSHIGAS